MTQAFWTRPFAWLGRSLKGVGEMWSEPADPRAVAIYRVLIYGFIARAFGSDLAEELLNAGEYHWAPRSFYALLDLQPPSAATGSVLVQVMTISALLAAVGCLYRVTAPVAAILALYFFGMMMNFGKTLHTYYVFSIVAVALSLARAADAWSVDALARRAIARFRRVAYAPPARDPAYRWPCLFAGSCLLVMYGAAGLTKLDVSGLGWVFSDNFLNLLARENVGGFRGTLLSWLKENPSMCRVVAASGLCIEVGAWAGLLNRRLYWVCGWLAISLQYGIWLLMKISFGALPTVFAAFIPWDYVVRTGDALFAKARLRMSSSAG